MPVSLAGLRGGGGGGDTRACTRRDTYRIHAHTYTDVPYPLEVSQNQTCIPVDIVWHKEDA